MVWYLDVILLLYYVVCGLAQLDFNNEHLPEDECKEIITLTEPSGSVHMNNYPSPYKTGCTWQWTIVVPEKVSLHLTIEDTDVDSHEGDQLFIHTGGNETILVGQNTTENSTTVGSNITVFDSRLVTITFISPKRNMENIHRGFSIYYEITGIKQLTMEVLDVQPHKTEKYDETATTEVTSATIVTSLLPTTEITQIIHDSIVIDLNGLTPEAFSGMSDKFRAMIADLADAYCQKIQMNVTQKITFKTVELKAVVRCPKDWPNSDLCLQINFSVPVITINVYELTSTNLYAMWRTHSDDELLKRFGLVEYEVPQDNLVLVLWIATTGTLFLVFLVILMVVLRTEIVDNYIKRTRRDHSSYGTDSAWLNQVNEQQLVPPFFYPDERVKYDHKPLQLNNYAVEPYNTSMAIENHAFEHDTPAVKSNGQPGEPNEQTIDDFDSDDDTCYPPSPLSRPAMSRFEAGKLHPTLEPTHELETAF